MPSISGIFEIGDDDVRRVLGGDGERVLAVLRGVDDVARSA